MRQADIYPANLGEFPANLISASSSSESDTEVGRGVFAIIILEKAAGGRKHAVKIYSQNDSAPGSEHRRMHDLHLANELRLAGKLRHENIIAPSQVRIGALKTELIMDYAPNGSLESYAKRFGANGPPESEARRLFAALLRAVAYLHGQRVAHRDLKLENCVLDELWNLRLIDFGSAEEVDAHGYPRKGNGVLTGLSVLQGTPGYMSPESLSAAVNGQGTFSLLAADVWAMGVALYCLFNSSALPFSGRDANELMANVTAREAPRLHCRMAEPLMRNLLCKNPGGRPSVQSALRHEWINLSAVDAATTVSGAASLPSREAQYRPASRGPGYPPAPHTSSIVGIREEEAELLAAHAVLRKAAARNPLDANASSAARSAHTAGQQANIESARAAAAAYNRMMDARPAASQMDFPARQDHTGQMLRDPIPRAAHGFRPPSAEARGRFAKVDGYADGGHAPVRVWRGNLPPDRPQTANVRDPPEFFASLSLRGFASLGLGR